MTSLDQAAVAAPPPPTTPSRRATVRPLAVDAYWHPALTTPRPGLARDLLVLVRPHQWAKNLLAVPLVLLDARNLTPAGLGRVGWAVLAFTLASAFIYVLNDVTDRYRDRVHPVKQHRPVAAGRVGVRLAVGYAGLIAAALTALVAALPELAWWPVLVYLGLNLAYTRGLKHVPLVDIFVVALGFVLRVAQGYLAAGVPTSTWLLIAVFALSLLLVIGKRRHEHRVGGTGHRPALRGYSGQYLEYLLVFCALLTVTTFLLHLQDTVAPPYTDLALLGSVPFALFALARYLQIVVVDGDGGEPTRTLLRDRVLVVTAVLWAALLVPTLIVAGGPAL